MKKNFLAILFILPFMVFGQSGANTDTTYWTKGGTVAFDFSNVILKNWAGGGLNSLSGKGLVSLFGNYKKGNQTWDNTLELGYGLVNQFDTDPDDNIDDGLLYKSDDRIDFASKYGYGLKESDNWYYSGLLNFRSQFAPGFASPADSKDPSLKISDFLAPAYLIAAAGMDYKLENKAVPSTFSLFISPATAKFTIVNDDLLNGIGAFGVDTGEVIRTEFGGYIKLAYNRKIYEHKNDKNQITEAMTFDTKLDVFSNYSENPQNLDINWTTLISMRFLKYFTFTSGTHLVYDDDIKSKSVNVFDAAGNDTGVNRIVSGVQFKWVTGLGFSYQF